MTNHSQKSVAYNQSASIQPPSLRGTCYSIDTTQLAPGPQADTSENSLLTLLRGPSEAMRQLWSKMHELAPKVQVLLLTGECGSGAEVVARLLHSLSQFRNGPFICVNREAVALNLRRPRCLLRQVTGGVLFLDEVDQLPADAQLDLIRLLRLSRLHPCALVAFASRGLESLSSEGKYSPPLANILSCVHLNVPPLRDRIDDLPLLMEALLREASTRSGSSVPALSSSFIEEALRFEWPGNLRQLRAMMDVLISTPQLSPLTASDFRSALADLRYAEQRARNAASARLVKLDVVVQEHIKSVMMACHGNKLRTSEILGISRSTLYRLLGSETTRAESLFS